MRLVKKTDSKREERKDLFKQHRGYLQTGFFKEQATPQQECLLKYAFRGHTATLWVGEGKGEAGVSFPDIHTLRFTLMQNAQNEVQIALHLASVRNPGWLAGSPASSSSYLHQLGYRATVTPRKFRGRLDPVWDRRLRKAELCRTGAFPVRMQ